LWKGIVYLEALKLEVLLGSHDHTNGCIDIRMQMQIDLVLADDAESTLRQTDLVTFNRVPGLGQGMNDIRGAHGTKQPALIAGLAEISASPESRSSSARRSSNRATFAGVASVALPVGIR
jgi:hypothetical protein